MVVELQTGRAPNSIELAATLGLDPGKARAVFSDIMATGYPSWLDEHDNIVTICPFSNRPNQYEISVDGEQKWFGQWGIELLAVCWLFPGKLIRIDATCPDCNESIVVEMRHGDVVLCEPEGAVVHDNEPSGNPWPDQ